VPLNNLSPPSHDPLESFHAKKCSSERMEDLHFILHNNRIKACGISKAKAGSNRKVIRGLRKC
jgi:hypothetical protein